MKNLIKLIGYHLAICLLLTACSDKDQQISPDKAGELYFLNGKNISAAELNKMDHSRLIFVPRENNIAGAPAACDVFASEADFIAWAKNDKNGKALITLHQAVEQAKKESKIPQLKAASRPVPAPEQLQQGQYAFLYEHWKFEGGVFFAYQYSAYPSLGDYGWNDIISSYNNASSRQMAVFEHWYYGGARMYIPTGFSSQVLTEWWNDRISSLYFF